MAYFEIKSEVGVNANLAAVRKNNFMDILDALPAVGRPAYADKYSFYIAQNPVSYEQFVEAARQQRDLWLTNDKRKWAFLPTSQGVSGLQKKMVKVRRDRLQHISSDNCQCTKCFTEAA